MPPRATAAYLGIILIWSTTPLGIKWSGEEGVGFLFGVTARMVLGCLFAWLLVAWLRLPVRRTRTALTAYALSALSIYGSMVFAYWGMTYIPSAWLSVIWGTAPVFTGILAYRLLGESLTWQRWAGILLSLLGVAVIFLRSGEAGHMAWLGVSLVLVGVTMQCLTAVWLKSLQANEHGLVMAATGLLISAPFFILTWWLFDGQLPTTLPARAGWSIVYLAIFGSVIGFSLYYYLINQISANALALINLITPVTALWVGNWLNAEPLTLSIYLGTGLILAGLVLYQWQRPR